MKKLQGERSKEKRSGKEDNKPKGEQQKK